MVTQVVPPRYLHQLVLVEFPFNNESSWKTSLLTSAYPYQFWTSQPCGSNQLSKKNRIRMPLQQFFVGPVLVVSWDPDLLPLDRIVWFTVVKIILEPSADMEPMIRSDCDVPTIIEAMYVGSH